MSPKTVGGKKMQEMVTENETPKFTTERFYVEHILKHGMASLKRHINRYKWAASHLQNGWRVLDIGCGSGYGDPILLNVCQEVVGIDKSEEAINYANRKAVKMKYGERLKYSIIDVKDINGDESFAKFDAIVCIEMIEHIAKDEQYALLNSIKKRMKHDSLLLITTPIKGTNKVTEYHVHEMTKNEFGTLLDQHFESVKFDDSLKFGIPAGFVLAICSRARI